LRQTTAALVALSLGVATLTGCGQYYAGSPNARVAAETTASASKDTKLAKDFAALLKGQQYENVTTRGTRVILSTDGVATTYDFAGAEKSGVVRVTAGEFTTAVSHKKLVETVQNGASDVLPAMLVPIAIQIALGGAIKLAQYALTHRGDNFDKEQAVKAMLEGMIAAAIPLVRDVKYAQYLVPLAYAILRNAKSLDYKELAHTAMGMIDDIVKVLMQMIMAAKAAVNSKEITVAKANA
jgi:hypothetical protein